MKQGIKNIKLHIMMVAVLFMTVATVIVAPGTASATGCRKTEVGMNNGTNTNQWAHFSEGIVDYWYTDWLQSPSWATGCKDVNVNFVSVPGDTVGGQCVEFRAMRKYDGKRSSWWAICPGDLWKVIFTGIYSNTYRVEARPTTNYNYRPYYMIMD